MGESSGDGSGRRRWWGCRSPSAEDEFGGGGGSHAKKKRREGDGGGHWNEKGAKIGSLVLLFYFIILYDYYTFKYEPSK